MQAERAKEQAREQVEASEWNLRWASAAINLLRQALVGTPGLTGRDVGSLRKRQAEATEQIRDLEQKIQATKGSKSLSNLNTYQIGSGSQVIPHHLQYSIAGRPLGTDESAARRWLRCSRRI
jgi:hypothetical protein